MSQLELNFSDHSLGLITTFLGLLFFYKVK